MGIKGKRLLCDGRWADQREPAPRHGMHPPPQTALRSGSVSTCFGYRHAAVRVHKIMLGGELKKLMMGYGLVSPDEMFK